MNVLNIVVSHQTPRDLARTLEWWTDVCEKKNLLLAYGGSEKLFDLIEHEPKIFITDARLRTRDHQREKQSYTAIFQAARAWMSAEQCDVDFVHFSEFDQLPLVPNLNSRQIALLERENADLLGFHLSQIDNTSHPHYLYHIADPRFGQWLREISIRSEPTTVLSMLATGSFWRRECFDAVASIDETCPIYVELYLPTLAHHLGFRVKDYGEQGDFVSHQGERSAQLTEARRKGAWTLHPVKRSLPPAKAAS